jgi:hypothetical protein
MGKASRRKRKHAAEAPPCDIRKESTTNEPHTGRPILRHLRRKALTYALIGTTVLGGWFVYEQLPFWTGTKKAYSMELIFLGHNSSKSAMYLLNEIDQASKSGKPFKVLFVENAGLSTSDYKNFVETLNFGLSKVKREYFERLQQGFSKQKAEEVCIKLVRQEIVGANNSENNEFIVTLAFGAAIRGLVVLPIEVHSVEEAQEVNRDSIISNTILARRRELIMRNAPLKEFMLDCKRLNDLVIREYEFRNAEIVKGLDTRFDDAIKFFPSLGWERLKGSDLRAIGFMGVQHYLPIRNAYPYKTSRVDFHPEHHTYNYSLTDIIHSNRQPGPLTEREAYLIAIDKLFLAHLNFEKLSQVYPKFGETLIENAMGLTVEELRRIDTESSAILDFDAKGRFILNAIAERKNNKISYPMEF